MFRAAAAVLLASAGVVRAQLSASECLGQTQSIFAGACGLSLITASCDDDSQTIFDAVTPSLLCDDGNAPDGCGELFSTTFSSLDSQGCCAADLFATSSALLSESGCGGSPTMDFTGLSYSTEYYCSYANVSSYSSAVTDPYGVGDNGALYCMDNDMFPAYMNATGKVLGTVGHFLNMSDTASAASVAATIDCDFMSSVACCARNLADLTSEMCPGSIPGGFDPVLVEQWLTLAATACSLQSPPVVIDTMSVCDGNRVIPETGSGLCLTSAEECGEGGSESDGAASVFGHCGMLSTLLAVTLASYALFGDSRHGL